MSCTPARHSEAAEIEIAFDFLSEEFTLAALKNIQKAPMDISLLAATEIPEISYRL